MKTVEPSFFDQSIIELQEDICISEQFDSFSSFDGKLYGNGYTVYIHSESTPIFETIESSGKIRNLTIEFRDYSSTSVKSTLASENLGKIKNINIKKCNLKSYCKNKGSFIGVNKGSLINCNSFGVLQGVSQIGGICGRNSMTGTVKNCSFTGIVKGKNRVGGLVGLNIGCLLESHSNISIQSAATISNQKGGLVGCNCGTINKCISKGNIQGTKCVGGIAGEDIEGVCSRTYTTALPQGSEETGLLVGKTTNSTISTVYTISRSNRNLIGLRDSNSSYNNLLKAQDFSESEVKAVLV